MIDEYLQELADDERAALQPVVDQVRALVPGAEEGRSYGMPAFRYRGKALLGFAAAKQHLSLFPFSPAAVESVQNELAGFSLSKGTVRFTPDRPVPPAVVEQMVRHRMGEIDAKAGPQRDA